MARELPPAVRALTAAILEENPLHAGYLQSSLAGVRDEALASLDSYVAYCASVGRDATYLARAYNTIVNDTLGEQYYFFKHGRYRYSSFADVAQHVYFEPDYMQRYMYGLALTAFLWPNHARMFEFFVETFPHGRQGRYLEVGPGHGYYLRRAAELGRFAELVGIDLSPTSVAMTREILSHLDLPQMGRVRIVEADFLSFAESGGAYDCVVMGEVLEHVERPGAFLEAIVELSTPQTHVFVTTCINAPAVDHIYLFESTTQLEELIESSGLTVVNCCYAPAVGKTLEQCAGERLPVNVAYTLRCR